MTDVAAPGAAPPTATPAADKPTHAPHPLIPPLRKPVQAAQPEPAPVAKASEAAPAVEPGPAPEIEAKAAPEVDEDGNELVEYDPTDEFDVVINGKPSTVTLGKLIAAYQRGEAANEKFTQAKRVEHNAVAVVQEMTTPDGFVARMRAMRLDPYRVAEDIILARADEEAMTPEQREAAQFKREKAAWEKQRAEETARTQQTQAEQQAAAWQARALEAMTSTMDRSHVPADPGLRNELISRAAGILKADLTAGVETTPQQAITEAWEDYRDRLASHSRALPVEQRVSAEERERLTKQAAQDRVRVAQQAPKHNVRDPNDGKFAPAGPPPKKRFDPFNPVLTGGKR